MKKKKKKGWLCVRIFFFFLKNLQKLVNRTAPNT